MDIRLVCEVLWLGIRDNGLGQEYRFPICDLLVLEQLWHHNKNVASEGGLIQSDVRLADRGVSVPGDVYPKEVVSITRW